MNENRYFCITNIKSTYLSIQDNLYFFQGTEFGEFLFQFPLRRVKTESKNTETVGHFWGVPTSDMPPSVTHGGSTSRPGKTKKKG